MHTHTRANEDLRPKYTSAVRAPSALRHFYHQEGSPTPSECGQVFETVSSWGSCTCVELVRNGTQKVKYIWAFRLLLLNGNVLKTDSKTEPTSKLNCRVIIFIYKLGYVKCKKRRYLKPLRAMNEHDETAPAAFRFLYSTLTKRIDAYSLSLLFKKYAVNKLSV